MPSPRALSTVVAAGRVGVGAALLAAPGASGRPFLGAGAETGGGGVAVRAFGGRDLALGALTAASLSGRLGTSSTATTLVAASGFCDLVDGVALLAARREIPAAGVATGVFALGSALFGLALARRLRAESR